MLKNVQFNFLLFKVLPHQNYLIFFFIVLFFLFGCSQVVDFSEIIKIDHQARKELEYEIQDTFSEPDSVNVIIDITGSMQGYSNASNSLKSFLMDIDASFKPKKVNYYSFSKELIKQDNYLPFLNSKIYTAEKTNYQILEEFIKKNKGLIILITDLQFNNDNDRLNLTNILRKLLCDHYFIKILGAKIGFHGKYYPRGGNPNLKYEGERPVYAIIFSQYKHKKFVERALRNSRIWKHSLSLYNKLPLKITIDTFESDFFSDYIENPKNSIVIYNFNKGNLNIKLQLENEILHEWSSFSKRDIIVDFFKVKKRKDILKFEKLYNLGYINKVSKNKKNMIFVELILDRIFIKNHYFIVIKINPHNLPDWIKDWSIETKDNPERQATHTLYLDRIFKDLISSVTKPYILGFSIIHLKNT